VTDHDSSDTENSGAPPDHLAGLAGMDLVRRTLEEARGVARSQGKDVGRGRNFAGPRRVAGRRRTWSGPGPDARDPQTLGAVTRDLAKTRGWSSRVAEGTVFGQWQTVVGEQIASHATPTALREGVLSVSAETTAWATQLRMVQAQLLAKIAAAVGDGVVTSLRIVGPVGPSWRKGRYHIAGRGPRDTYG
jgi:predicted nucleic acid-binding Zn ribbon protein